ncbi:MAG TPA: recombinase family protein [Symbiobacteriaceae bacterium]|nr:recombinase family protein [Symbiobacteriaceae bacterium]
MTAIRPDHVAIYIRWSTDDQGEGTTLAVQLEGCRHYALSQGWQYSPALLFVDDGCSGATLDRPALTRLRQAVQQGFVDCVVVLKIDRLSRNVVDTVNLVLREWDGRCHVKSAREAIDTATQQGRMFFYTLVSFAEWERSVIRERTWSGRMKRLQEGKNPGFRPPYGLSTGEAPGTFALVEDEAAVVRHIYALYARGLGYKAIAVHLGRQGISFRGGRPWNAQTVADILRNPIYTGRLAYGRRSGGPATLVESALIPHLVEPALFDQAQARRRRRAEGRAPNRAVSSDHLLTGLLRCQRCGAALIGRKVYRAGSLPPYYMCSGRRNKGAAHCDAGYLRQDLLDSWFVARLMQRYSQARLELRVLDARQRAAALEKALAGVRRELGALDRELAVAGRDYRRERLTAEEYREQRAAVERERAGLLEQEARLTGTLAALREPHPVSSIHVDHWDRLTLAERKHLLRELTDGLTVYRAPGSDQVHYSLTWVADAT